MKRTERPNFDFKVLNDLKALKQASDPKVEEKSKQIVENYKNIE